jgi:tRNA(adenine34) deaminase
MDYCLTLAETALPDDVPVGAVVLDANGVLIGQGVNTRERLKNPLGHAELNAVAAATSHLGQWRLEGCTVVVTLEPCPMCASALAQARIQRIVYGAGDSHMGGCGGWLEAHHKPAQPILIGGILEESCQARLQQFFAKRRV